jgi:3'(2'), 5'-bisphosphate nucleotidase
MDLADLKKWSVKVRQLSLQASEQIMAIYQSDYDIEQKADNTPVTTADKAAHEVIVQGLLRLTPQFPVLSEESVEIPFAERTTWETYWLVDPLDGTQEFIDRNGHFTVNIALIHQHKAVLGVVTVPISRLSYFAVVGEGAYKQIGGQQSEKICVRTLDGHPVMVAGSRSHRGKLLQQYLSNLGECEVFYVGSALKSCLVAEGKVDIYPRLGPTSEWDTAAAQCIVEEAGGAITDIDLQPLRYNTKASLLNPYFFVFGGGDHDWRQYLPEGLFYEGSHDDSTIGC